MTVHADSDKAVLSGEVAFSNATNTEVSFGSVITSLVVKTTQDVRLGFDAPANADDFLLASTDLSVRIDPCKATRLYLLGNSTTGTLYYIASR